MGSKPCGCPFHIRRELKREVGSGMVLKRNVTLMSEGRGMENVGEVRGCGQHGVNPQLSPEASPSSRGLWGRKSPREWRKGDSIVRLRPLGRDYGGSSPVLQPALAPPSGEPRSFEGGWGKTKIPGSLGPPTPGLNPWVGSWNSLGSLGPGGRVL